MPGRIFISYRRDDGAASAARIRDRLVQTFGESSVFMDVDNLMAGQRFDVELAKALQECDVFIAVIGRRWIELLKEKEQAGDRDYVREEIAAALANIRIVIPVLVDRAQLPREELLAQDIRQLLLHQKHDATHERFHRDIDDLIAAINASRKAIEQPAGSRKRAFIPLVLAGAAFAAAGALAWFAFPDMSQAPFVSAKPPSEQAASKETQVRNAQRIEMAEAVEREKQARQRAELIARHQAEIAAAAVHDLEEKRRAEAEEDAKRKKEAELRTKADAAAQNALEKQRQQAIEHERQARLHAEAEASRHAELAAVAVRELEQQRVREREESEKRRVNEEARARANDVSQSTSAVVDVSRHETPKTMAHDLDALIAADGATISIDATGDQIFITTHDNSTTRGRLGAQFLSTQLKMNFTEAGFSAKSGQPDVSAVQGIAGLMPDEPNGRRRIFLVELYATDNSASQFDKRERRFSVLSLSGSDGGSECQITNWQKTTDAKNGKKPGIRGGTCHIVSGKIPIKQ